LRDEEMRDEQKNMMRDEKKMLRDEKFISQLSSLIGFVE
jgi:hypothetical protein